MSSPNTVTRSRPEPPFTTADKAQREIEQARGRKWFDPSTEVRAKTPDERLMEVFEDGQSSGSSSALRDPQSDGPRVDWPLKSRLKESQ